MGSITILGTGGDTTVIGRQKRKSGGIIITTEENQIHIDPGPGSLNAMAEYGIHPRETTAIIISHNHVNHSNDVNAIISSMTHNGADKHGVIISPEPEKSASEFHKKQVEKTIQLKPGDRVAINDVEIRATKAEHYGEKAVGYIITTPDYTLGYTGDTRYEEEIAEQYKGVNVMIINCKLPDNTKEGDHLNLEDTEKLLKKTKPALAIITHFGNKMLEKNPLAQARELHKKTKTQVIAAYDGMNITPAHYSAKKKQQTLNEF